MTFTNQFPKNEVIIETIKEVSSLICDHSAVVHYRHYQGYLDKVDHITLTGPKNAWYGIKTEFIYDKSMNQIKDVYTDEFGRQMNVNILN